MIVPSHALEKYLIPGRTIELRDEKWKLANPTLPYGEAWRMALAGEVEGKVSGKKLKYLRILTSSEVEERKKSLDLAIRPEAREGGGCVLPSRLGLGVRRQALKAAIVGTDPWGKRSVVGEGEIIGHIYQHCGVEGGL